MFKQKKLGFFCMLYLIFMVILAIFADFFAPYPMVNGSMQLDPLNALQNPSLTNGHLLGTDVLGKDVLSYLIYGARTSVILCLGCTALSTVIAVLLGTLSAVIGGWFDLLVQRFVDAWTCIPSMLILLILMSMLGSGIPQMIVAMAVPSGIGGSRMIRSSAISVRGSGYVHASELLGAGVWYKTIHHVIPNITPLIITNMAGQLGGIVMQEASLNFLGFGVDPTTPSWGALITDQGRSYIFSCPGLCIFPGICIALLVFAATMFGDSVRDVLDPRIQGGYAPTYNAEKGNKLFNKMISKKPYKQKVSDLEQQMSSQQS